MVYVFHLLTQTVFDRRIIKNNMTIYYCSPAYQTLFFCIASFQSVILSTIPHPAIAATTDPVMADSFPMVAGLRTRMGSNLVGEFSWQYSVTTNGRGRSIGRGGSSASDMMNIRKTMVVNGKNLLTVFYDKLQKREVIYAEETQVILNIT